MRLGPLYIGKTATVGRLRASAQANAATVKRLQELRAGAAAGKWHPAVRKLVGVIDGFAGGKHGIRPRLSGHDAFDAWDDYLVDEAQTLTPRDCLRIVITSLTLYDEAYVSRRQGLHTPMPRPTRIEYDKETRLPVEYVWRWNDGTEQTLPAAQVMHLIIRWLPGQREGKDIIADTQDALGERSAFVTALVKAAKIAARYKLVHKRKSGSWSADIDSTAETAKEAANTATEVDFDNDGFIDIGPSDELLAVDAKPGPIAPDALDKAIHTGFGQEAQLSRMLVMGDFGDVNYSSARFAMLTDQTTFDRMQEMGLRLVRSMYRAWPELPTYADRFRGWHLPPYKSVDPGKTAAENRIYIADRVKSIQQVQRELELDPEEMEREIREYLSRNGNEVDDAQSP